MASITGDISFMPVGDVVLWIANRRHSGTLVVRRGAVESSFVVRNGLAWRASSSDPREYLGQHLINFGYIDEDQLQKAFDTQQETHVPLGRVLVMVEAVTNEQLSRVLLFKTRESLLETMSWSEGTFRVSREVPEDTDLDNEVPIDLFEVHSEGTARAQMWTEIRRVFPSDATRCDVLVDAARVESAFDRRLLSLMAQGKSAGEASLELRSMDFQTYARLYDLYNRKLIRPRTLTSKVSGPITKEQALAMLGGAAAHVAAHDLPVVQGAPAPTSGAGGQYIYVRPEKPTEAPGVQVPAEAHDPAAALRVALAGRNWSEALLLSERILEQDPHNSEAIAAYRVAELQVRRQQSQAGGRSALDLGAVPSLAVARTQIALAHLTSKERYVLSRIDGRRTLQQIAAVSPIQRDELVRIVEAFVARGVVRLGP